MSPTKWIIFLIIKLKSHSSLKNKLFYFFLSVLIKEDEFNNNIIDNFNLYVTYDNKYVYRGSKT